MSAPTGRPAPPPPQPRPAAAPPEPGSVARRTNARAWVVVTVVVLGLALVALIAATTSRGEEPAGQRPGDEPRSVSGRLDGRQDAHFELVGGAERVTVHSADLGEDLYRAETPEGGALVPRVAEEGGRITVNLTSSGGTGVASVDIQLSTKVRWKLTLAGGGLQQTVSFADGRLAALEFTAGSSEIDLTVPRPEGTLPITLSVGAGRLAVHAPPGVPAQIRLAGGAGTVTVDGAVRTGASGGTTMTQPGWAQAADRYDISLTVGVSTVTVDRHQH